MSTDDYGFAIPGSVDNGATDVEYSPRPERLICASDEHYATHAELVELAGDTWTVIDELEARIVALEGHVHRLLNTESPAAIANNSYAAGYQDGKAAGIVAGGRLDLAYAHIPHAAYEALCAEVEALRAFKSAVPWDALNTAIWLMASYLPGSKEADYDALIALVESNAPKEAAE